MITLSQGSFGSEGDDVEDLMGLVFLLFSNIFTRFETPAGKSLLHSPGEGYKKVEGFGILLKLSRHFIQTLDVFGLGKL